MQWLRKSNKHLSRGWRRLPMFLFWRITCYPSDMDSLFNNKCNIITAGLYMYILSLFFGLSIQNSVNSWPNHFKISKVVVDKRTSGCRSITSSIHLNWNISVIYCRIEIKLDSIKAEWRWVLFRKNYFFKLVPVSQTWRHKAFNCGYLS